MCHQVLNQISPVSQLLEIRNMKKNKRSQLEAVDFDFSYLSKLMRQLFPKKNDCSTKEDLKETISELKKFGVVSKKDLRLFLKKHRKWLIEIDQEPMDSCHHKLYREDLGDKVYLDCIKRQYWFCYPAFIRNALEKEFGAGYEQFSNKRDNVN